MAHEKPIPYPSGGGLSHSEKGSEIMKAETRSQSNRVSKESNTLITNELRETFDTLNDTNTTGKVSVKTKSDKTAVKVSKAYKQWVSKKNYKPTQKDISDKTGCSLSTVKRYWHVTK